MLLIMLKQTYFFQIVGIYMSLMSEYNFQFILDITYCNFL